MIAPAIVLASCTVGAAQAQSLFGPPLQFPTDQQTIGVAADDINSDGRKDVVVSGCACGAQANSKLYIYLQRADGSLNPTPVIYLPQNSPGGVSIGDLTGDGRNDLLLRSGLGFEVVPQNAAGTLDPSTFYPSNFSEVARIGDLNGDGRLDAIGLESSPDGHVNTEEAGVLYQNASGSFDPQVLVPLPHGFNDDLELADLNGDGRTDVIDADPFNEPAVVILYQTATGTLSAPVGLSIAPGVFANQLGVGDVNNDGRKDIVATYGGWFSDAHVAVFYQNAAGGFSAPSIIDTTGELTAVEIGDFNGDGRKDVALLHRISVGILLQTATGTLGAETSIAIPEAGGHYQHGFVASDINGDNATDLAYAQVGSQGALTVLYGTMPAVSNHPPVAKADSATLSCDDSVVIAVLANDSDPDGNALKITAISKPANGTAKLTADGKRIRYEPKRRFRGTDRFTYTISDGKGGTASATVTVVVR